MCWVTIWLCIVKDLSKAEAFRFRVVFLKDELTFD